MAIAETGMKGQATNMSKEIMEEIEADLSNAMTDQTTTTEMTANLISVRKEKQTMRILIIDL